VFPDLYLYDNHCSYSDKTNFGFYPKLPSLLPFRPDGFLQAASSRRPVRAGESLRTAPQVGKVASGSQDRTIKLWDIPAAKQADK
jgi:hypothetical protein